MGLRMPAFCPIDLCKVMQEWDDFRIIRPIGPLRYFQRPLENTFSLGFPVLSSIDLRQVIERYCNVRVVRSKIFLSDCE